MSTFDLEFITPLFSRGAYEDRPEIRAASIRGQLHGWFRALGGAAADEKAIFGGVHDGAVASKIVVRVQADIRPEDGRWIPTLPHKPAGQREDYGPNAPRIGLHPGTRFTLHVLERLGGLGASRAKFDRTLEAWLLLGGLGLRCTRAAGNFRWTPGAGAPLRYPATFAEYDTRCQELLRGAPLRFGLLATEYSNGEAARRVVADTLGGRADRAGQNDLAALRDPLGKIIGGRKTSPLRFRVVAVGTNYRIAALWDARDRVTGNRPSDLKGVIDLLAAKKPALGMQLANSALAR